VFRAYISKAKLFAAATLDYELQTLVVSAAKYIVAPAVDRTWQQSEIQIFKFGRHDDSLFIESMDLPITYKFVVKVKGNW
jgi:hypothetical protein